jgi:hypothetical protein
LGDAWSRLITAADQTLELGCPLLALAWLLSTTENARFGARFERADSTAVNMHVSETGASAPLAGGTCCKWTKS